MHPTSRTTRAGLRRLDLAKTAASTVLRPTVLLLTLLLPTLLLPTLLLLTLLLPTPSAVAAPPRPSPTPTASSVGAPVPQLSISVDNGRTAVRPGDKLSYTIIVSNLGATTVEELRLTQTLPTAATFTSADRSGRRRDRQVLWTVRVPAAGHATVHAVVTAPAHPPKNLLRLASVACVQTVQAVAPLVCASDSDQLPGAAAAQASVPAEQPASDPGRPDHLLPYGLGVALLAAAGLLAVGWRRRTVGLRLDG